MVDDVLDALNEALNATAHARLAVASALLQLEECVHRLDETQAKEGEVSAMVQRCRVLLHLDAELFRHQFRLTGPRDVYSYCAGLPVDDAFAPDVLRTCAKEAREAEQLAARVQARAEEFLLITHRERAQLRGGEEGRALH